MALIAKANVNVGGVVYHEGQELPEQGVDSERLLRLGVAEEKTATKRKAESAGDSVKDSLEDAVEDVKDALTPRRRKRSA